MVQIRLTEKKVVHKPNLCDTEFAKTKKHRREEVGARKDHIAIAQKSLWGMSSGESFPALEQLFKLKLGLFGGTGVKSERGTVDLHT